MKRNTIFHELIGTISRMQIIDRSKFYTFNQIREEQEFVSFDKDDSRMQAVMTKSGCNKESVCVCKVV